MNVRFTGRHVGIGEEDREYAEAKVAVLVRYHKRLSDLEVRVMVDGSGREKVELEADIGKHRAVAAADAPLFRTAFDRAVEALKRQLQKDKEKVVDRRRRPSRGHGVRTPALPASGPPASGPPLSGEGAP
jgi:ribosomal subunit interface protein